MSLSIEILGHPIMIGDVLAKIILDDADWANDPNEIVGLWAKCGINNSLQQIVEESGYDEKTEYDPNRDEVDIVDSRLKSPEARALLERLAELFPESK